MGPALYSFRTLFGCFGHFSASFSTYFDFPGIPTKRPTPVVTFRQELSGLGRRDWPKSVCATRGLFVFQCFMPLLVFSGMSKCRTRAVGVGKFPHKTDIFNVSRSQKCVLLDPSDLNQSLSDRHFEYGVRPCQNGVHGCTSGHHPWVIMPHPVYTLPNPASQTAMLHGGHAGTALHAVEAPCSFRL